MRKSFIIAALVGAVMLITSCEKEITTSEVKIDVSKRANIKLYVQAELNRKKDGLEKVEDGTVLNVSVAYSEFNPSYTGDGSWDTTVVTTNGVSEFKVPTTTDGVTVEIEAQSFEYEYDYDISTISLRKYTYSDTIEAKANSNNYKLIEMQETELDSYEN